MNPTTTSTSIYFDRTQGYDLERQVFDDGQDEANEDYALILQEYRRKRLIEALIGPIVSTVFHVILIVVLAILITDEYKQQVAEISVVLEEIEEIELEPPPEIEQPEPEPEPTDTTNPVLTTVKIENVDTNDAALEDADDNEPQTDDSLDQEMVSDVVVSPSAFASPSVYGGRTAAGRASSVSKFGGTTVGQEALMRALWWLAKVQNPDGSWGKAQKEAMTGLAVLTFLAHGETTSSKHFGKNVKLGVKWLCEKIEKGKNKIQGQDNKGGGGKNGRSVYSHALMAYALSEATAMIGASQIEEAMNNAIRVVIDGQMKNGGYFYNYQKNGPSNLSNASFNYQALKAAYSAGSEEPGLYEAIEKSISHLKETCKETEWYYRSDNKNSRGPSMRCVGTLCLQLLGEPESEEAQRIGAFIEKNDQQYLVWKGEKGNSPLAFPLYFWYYGTQVMFQRGGIGWKNWNRKFQKLLTDNQYKDGHWETPSAFEGDRFSMPGIDKQVYSTTLCALMLTVYYRYLPSSKAIGPKGGELKQAKGKKKEPVMEEEGLDLVD